MPKSRSAKEIAFWIGVAIAVLMIVIGILGMVFTPSSSSSRKSK